MRINRVAAIAIGALALVAAAAAVLLIRDGGGFLSQFVQERASGALGRAVLIGGVAVEWGRRSTIVADDVHVANAPWGTAPDMFAARRMAIVIDPLRFLALQLRILSFTVEDASIALETSASGENNWDALTRRPAPTGDFAGLGDIVLRRTVVMRRDASAGSERKVAIDELHAGGVDANSFRVEARGAIDGTPFDLAGDAVSRGSGVATPLEMNLRGRVGTSEIALKGEVAKPLTFRGSDLEFSLRGGDSRDLAVFAGLPKAKTAPYGATGRLSEEGNVWQFEKLVLEWGRSRLAGGLFLDRSGDRPRLEGNFISSYVALDELVGLLWDAPAGSPRSARHAPGDRVIPDVPIVPGWLRGADADMAFAGDAVKLDDGPTLDRVSVAVAVQDGALRIPSFHASLAKGEIAGDLAAPRDEKAPSELGLDASTVDLRQLLGAFRASPTFRETSGLGGGSLRLKSHGASLRRFLAGMEGEVGLFVQQGRLSHELVRLFGLELLNLGGKETRAHQINCLVARFAVRDGVATASTLLIDTPDALVEGRGNLNFGDETVHLDFIPHPKRSAAPAVSAPMELRGTFSRLDAQPHTLDVGANALAALAQSIFSPSDEPGAASGLGPPNRCRRVFLRAEGR